MSDAYNVREFGDCVCPGRERPCPVSGTPCTCCAACEIDCRGEARLRAEEAALAAQEPPDAD